MTLERLYAELRAAGYRRLSRKRKKEVKRLLEQEAEILATCMAFTRAFDVLSVTC